MKVKTEQAQFIGRRYGLECSVEVIEDGKGQPLPLRLDLANHSPTGFSWGYSGSGPAQLALALCAAVVDDDAALVSYQLIKDSIIAGIQADAWTISAYQLRKAISVHDPIEHCPRCNAAIAYTSWISVHDEPNLLGCPACHFPSNIETIYPTAQRPEE